MLHNNHSQLAGNPQQLEQYLLALTDPHRVKEATNVLQSFFTNPEACGPLLNVLAQSKDHVARNLAAVYLRSKFALYSKALNEDAIVNLQSQIVQVFLREQDRKTMNSIGQLIVRVAKNFQFDENNAELLKLIHEKILPDPNRTSQTKEVCFVIMRNLCSQTEGQPFEFYATAFEKGLKGSQKMQIESLKGFQEIGLNLPIVNIDGSPTEQGKQLPQIYKMMAQVCQKLITHEDEAISRYVVEMWANLLEQNCLLGAETDIYQFMILVATQTQLPVNVRYQVVDYMTSYCKRYPNKLIKDGLLQPTMELCINLLEEQYSGSDDDISYPLNMAVEILDAIFLNVRVDHTASMAFKGVEQLMKGKRPISALALLAIMAEGCCELLSDRQTFLQCWEFIKAQCQNESPEVRKTAYEAITQMIYHVPHPAETLPDIMNVIQQALVKEQNDKNNLEAVIIALDSTSSVLGKRIKPFLEGIVQSCMNIVATSKDLSIISSAVSTMSSTMMTSREVSLDLKNVAQQFAGKLYEMYTQLTDENDDKQMELKGEVINGLGEVCLTLGPEATTEIDKKTDLIWSIIRGAAKSKDSNLRECSFGFFSSISEIFKDQLIGEKIFEAMVKLLTECLDSEDGLVQKKAEDGFGNTGGGLQEDEEESGEFYCTTGFLEEKASAARAIAQFAKSSGPKFQLYWKTTWENAIATLLYPEPNLRQATIYMVHEISKNMLQTVKASQCMNKQTENEAVEHIQMVVTLFLIHIAQEEDKTCCLQYLSALAELCEIDAQRVLGLHGQNPAVLIDGSKEGGGDTETSWVELMEIMHMLFNEEAPCQKPDDDELDCGKRETEDNEILDGLTMVSTSLCKGLSEVQLVEFWKVVFPMLGRFLMPERSHVEYSLAIGTMGDVSSHFSEQAIAPFFEKSVEMAFKGLSRSQHHLVRQNSVYALGCLCRAGGAGMKKYLPNLVSVLADICKMPRGLPDSKDHFLRDNGYSALSSMLAFCSGDFEAKIFRQFFETFLSGLPLEGDKDENEWVARNLLTILEKRPQLMEAYNAQISQILRQATTWEKMPKELLEKINTAVQFLQRGASAI